MKIQKDYWVEYAHRLRGHNGLCRFLHGHSGFISVSFEGDMNSETGMVVDFGSLGWVKQIVDELDHSLILQKGDEVLDFLEQGIEAGKFDLRIVYLDTPPTAENLCMWVAKKIEIYLRDSYGLKGTNFRLKSVSFEETRKNRAIYEIA